MCVPSFGLPACKSWVHESEVSSHGNRRISAYVRVVVLGVLRRTVLSFGPTTRLFRRRLRPSGIRQAPYDPGQRCTLPLGSARRWVAHQTLRRVCGPPGVSHPLLQPPPHSTARHTLAVLIESHCQSPAHLQCVHAPHRLHGPPHAPEVLHRRRLVEADAHPQHQIRRLQILLQQLVEALRPIRPNPPPRVRAKVRAKAN